MHLGLPSVASHNCRLLRPCCRAYSNSGQLEGGIQWQLPPALQRTPSRAEQLPLRAPQGIHGCAAAAELLSLRQHCPVRRLATARLRGSSQHGAA